MTVPRFNPAGRFDPASLFHPRSIAVIGCGTETGAGIAGNLALSGFDGPMHLVATADALTERPDVAVLAVPPGEIGESMATLAEKGCFAAIVPGAADDLALHAGRTGVRVLGPFSFGLAVPGLRLNASRAHLPPAAGRLAFVGQSAALARAVIDWSEPNGVGFSHIVGIGGNADIGYGMVLDWLARDPGTGAILLDIRRIKDHRRFLSAARAASRLRPVVAIRAGLRLLDQDGSAELAFDSALRRAGVLTVRNLEQLLAAAETLSRAPPARADTVAIVANAVGPGRLAADAVLREGLTMPPDGGLCVVGTGDLAARSFALANRPGIGGVLVVHAPTGRADAAAIAALAAPPRALRAPVLICAMGETTGAPHRRDLARARLPVFATPDQAVQGFGHLVRDRRNREAARELPSSKVLPLDPDRALVRNCFNAPRRAGRLALTQDEALGVLEAYGIPAVPTRVAAGTEDAALAGDLLGYPVVLKLRGCEPPSERPPASLVLDLQDAGQVSAAARLLAASSQRRPGAGELLVQRAVGRCRETSVRVADDPTFGPVISFGSGGTAADPADRSMDLPPLNLALARALIRRSRSGATLSRPLRDGAPANTEAVAQALVRISQLVIDFPQVAVLEVPSLFVDADGVVAADAWLCLRAEDEPAPVPAIAPYPEELVEHRRIGDEMFIIRPIRPEDAEAHAAFFSRLSQQDIRYRFFSAIRALSPEQTVRLTQVDYDREMAFLAVRENTRETVGVSRLAREPNGRSAEFAVIVQEDMKGRGLGSLLMRRLIDWGRGQGLTEIVGQVLSDNAPMLAFVRHLGFSVRRMADDPEVMEVRLPLTGTVAA
jgi:acetyltransferase